MRTANGYCFDTCPLCPNRAGPAPACNFSEDGAPSPGHADRVLYICAIVELAEGCRMVTNLVNCEAGELKIGMDLKLAWDRLNDDFRFPVFELA